VTCTMFPRNRVQAAGVRENDPKTGRNRIKIMSRSFVLRAIALISAVTALSGCSPLVLLDRVVPHSGYEVVADIPYGPDPRHRLDVYVPIRTDPDAPVIVFFYGGSWKSGDRAQYRFVGQTFASRGYITVVADYRLFPQVRFPDFVSDGASAVRWVHRSIARFGGNGSSMVLMGHSAGAHIAALLALDRVYLETADVPPKAVSGLIGLAGPYSFDPLRYSSISPVFKHAKHVDDARPVTFADRNAPRSLLLHGLDDWTVNPRNSESLTAALIEANAPAQYVPLEDVGHAGILIALSLPFRRSAPVLDNVFAFLMSVKARMPASKAHSSRRGAVRRNRLEPVSGRHENPRQ